VTAIVYDSNGKQVDMVNGSPAIAEAIYNGTSLQKNPTTGAYEPFQSSITFDKKTGSINIKAPKMVTDTPEFKQTFDIDKLNEKCARFVEKAKEKKPMDLEAIIKMYEENSKKNR
jgi:hypothetical protein